MTAKEFVFNKYPHLKHPLEGENPVVDFELNTLCTWLEEYASHVNKSPTWIRAVVEYLDGLSQKAHLDKNSPANGEWNRGYHTGETHAYGTAILRLTELLSKIAPDSNSQE